MQVTIGFLLKIVTCCGIIVECLNLGKGELLGKDLKGKDLGKKTAYEILNGIKSCGGYASDNTPDEFKDLVYINRTGYPTKNSTYDAALQKRCEQAGVKKLSMHDLRHTMATRFCENSTNYKFLSRMLGHSSIKITVDTYVHQTGKSQAEEAERFSEYLDGLFL